MSSVFARYVERSYPFQFSGRIHVGLLAGGTPSNPEVAEAWIRAKGYTGGAKDQLIAEAVAELMHERGIDEKAAVEEVAKNRHLSGFKRDAEQGLYIEGRQLKACIKEAASVATAIGKLPSRWGNTKKGTLGFVSEHIFVPEQNLYLGAFEPTDVVQSFVHTWRGSGIHYTEVVAGAEFSFTVESDYEFQTAEWAMLWTTAERNGIGAGRSQGYGRFEVVEWGLPAKVGKSRRSPNGRADGVKVMA